MSVPRIVVNETLEIKRIAVVASGQSITVTIAEAAAGVSSVNGQTDVVVLSTTNITEGTNLYYTADRVNSAFDTRLATKTTSNLTEGTNLYFTNQRAIDAVGGSSGVITPGRWNSPYTENLVLRGFAQWAAGGTNNFSISNTSSVNDLTALTVSGWSTNTQPLQKWTASSSTVASMSTGGVLTAASVNLTTYPTTTNITEGTNLYYTDARARGAVSGSTGVSYNSSTGAISIGQAVGTAADVTFNTVNANLTDDNYVLGQLYATRNTAWTAPATTQTTLAGQNGFYAASSANGAGFAPAIQAIYYSGDTSAGTNSAAAFIGRGASGTNSAPGAAANNQVLGTFNWDGYGTTNWANSVATANQGAGTTSLSPMQMQGYARQAFVDSGSVATTVTGASGTGTTATLTFTTQNTAPYVVGQTVAIAGMTPSGYNNAAAVITAATTSSISYANTTTGFTSGGTITATRTVTQAGMGFRVRGYATSTNMTTANRFNFMDINAATATFKSAAYTFANDVITGSTLTATNYMTLNSATHTIGNIDGITNIVRSGTSAGQRPVQTVRYTQTATAAPATGDGPTYRLTTAGTNGTVYNLAEIGATYNSGGDTSFNFGLANGDQNTGTMSVVFPLISSLSTTTISATASPTATAGGNTLSTIAVFSADKILNNRPHRSAVTTASIARGSTYTPAAGVNNFIELTLTAGSDPTYIDVDNLTVAGEGGHQAILVYNNSGSSIGNGDLRIRNNGVQISDSHTTLANGARGIFTVYCIGNYASCEYMIAA